MTSLNDVEVHVLRRQRLLQDDLNSDIKWFSALCCQNTYIPEVPRIFFLPLLFFLWDQNWHYGVQMQQSCKHIRYSNLRSLRVALGCSHSRRQNYSLAIEYLLNGLHHTTWAFSGKAIHSWEAYLKTGKKKRSWRRRMGRKNEGTACWLVEGPSSRMLDSPLDTLKPHWSFRLDLRNLFVWLEC